MEENKRTQTGLTLVEILIALVVLSVGLLGIAGMQATGLRNNHAAYSKMQATNLAMDMADRIRSNPQGAATYNVGTLNAGNQPAAPNPVCITNGCTPAQLAQTDLFQWSRPILTNNSILPDGSASIAVNNDLVTITLFWREPNFGNIDLQSCGVNNPDDDMACFQMSFTL